ERDVALDEIVPAFAAAEVVHAEGVDDARAYRVDADFVRREFERHRAAEGVDGRLGGGVGGGGGRREFARNRGDVDDAAAVALRDHRAGGGVADFSGDAVDVAPSGGLFVIGILFGRTAGTGDDDGGAGVREDFSDGAANTAHPARARDDGDHAGEFMFHVFPPRIHVVRF